MSASSFLPRFGAQFTPQRSLSRKEMHELVNDTHVTREYLPPAPSMLGSTMISSSLLYEFSARFDLETALAEKHMHAMLKSLPQALTEAGVRYNAPMPHRIKTGQSAHGALLRRHAARMERLELKLRLEDASPKDPHVWANYWYQYQKPERIHDVGPFRSCDEMFESLHDLAGFRILLYFPGEVRKVIQVLEEQEEIEVVKVVERGGGIAPDMVRLKEHVSGLEGRTRLETTTNDKIFSGYRATHIIVRPRGKAKPYVEIQVASVVMNAWAQVEHDIIYKPSEEGYSKEVMQILDTFNGMVMLGENALRQLETTIKREKKDRDAELQTTAQDVYDLGQWIRDYYAKNRPDTPSSNRLSLESLRFLFRVLEIKGDQSLRLVNSLVHNVLEKDPETKFNDTLPSKLVTQSYGEINIECPNFSDQQERRKARLLARRVVESFNIAAYLGVLDTFASIFQSSFLEETPSLVDFLDILHPQSPRVHGNRDDHITQFAEKFLDQNILRQTLRTALHLSAHERVLMETCLILALSDIGAVPHDSQDEDVTTRSDVQQVVIPRILCQLLSDPHDCHWIPELCSVAQFLKDVGSESYVPLQHMFYQSDLHDEAPLMINALSTKHEQSTDQSANLFLAMTPQRVEFRRGKSNAWWEIVWLGGDRVLHEYHADKSKHANTTGHSRKHPGLFKSITMSEPDAIPRWSYHERPPAQWQLYSLEHQTGGLKIRREDPRHNELVDFGSSLEQVDSLKFSETTQDGGLLYALTVGGQDFHLKSRETDYVLHRKDFHDGIPTQPRILSDHQS